MKQIIKAFANRLGLSPITSACQWWNDTEGFEFEGRTFKLFVSNHNCGWPPFRMTERSVELALADFWLGRNAETDFVEIGAVTPYYWPRRIRTIIDPTDKHVLVTDPVSVMDYDLRGKHVISISTIEHIGRGDYGLEPCDSEACLAFDRIVQDAATALITFPIGFNATLDKYIAKEGSKNEVRIAFLGRGSSNNVWGQISNIDFEKFPYGYASIETGRRWANAICIVWKGEPFSLQNKSASLAEICMDKTQ